MSREELQKLKKLAIQASKKNCRNWTEENQQLKMNLVKANSNIG